MPADVLRLFVFARHAESVANAPPAVYAATTWGELRDLTADLPVPVTPTGLPSGIPASRLIELRRLPLV